MSSTFMGLEIGKRGLIAHQQAMTTAGHNISNADNENYSRQRVVMRTMTPLYEPSLNRANGPGMIGQGVAIESVTRVRDKFFDDRVQETKQAQSYWQTRSRYLTQTENILSEPSEFSLRSRLDKFWQSWQELSDKPEEYSHREVLLARSKQVTASFRDTFQKLLQVRIQADNELEDQVNRINHLSQEVALLNDKILKSQTLGDNPNDLLDRRDQLIEEMTTMADISFEVLDKDEIMVYLGGEILVQGQVFQKLKLEGDSANEGFKKILWAHDNREAVISSGSLRSLLQIRDEDVKHAIESIDEMAINLQDVVNSIHRDGFGLNKETNTDFFKTLNLSQNIRGNYDLNKDGTDDITAISRVSGKNELEARRPIGISGVMTFVQNNKEHTAIEIFYQPDDTVQAVMDRINHSQAGINAHLDHNNNLVLKATKAQDNWETNFVIRHIEDSGEFLTGFAGLLQNSGPAGAFDYRQINQMEKLQSDSERIALTSHFHPSAHLEVNSLLINNPAYIAAASGSDVTGSGDNNYAYGAKDGSNAQKIAQMMQHGEAMVGKHKTLHEYFTAMVSKVGADNQKAEEMETNQKAIFENLNAMRQAIMGVNLDEEMSSMIQFQHGYNAAARIINAVDEMIGRIIDTIGRG